jgi:hypothetical protein
LCPSPRKHSQQLWKHNKNDHQCCLIYAKVIITNSNMPSMSMLKRLVCTLCGWRVIFYAIFHFEQNRHLYNETISKNGIGNEVLVCISAPVYG